MTEWDAEDKYKRSHGMEELIEAQKRLKESEEEFRRILGEIPISMSIIQPDGEVLLVNKKTLEIFDVEEDDLSGFNVSWILANPGERDAWLHDIKARGIVSDYDIDVVTFTGARKIIRVSGLMITFEGQRCILSVHQDITEKNIAEDSLRKREEQLRTIYNTSPIAIGLYDADGYLIHANPAGLEVFGVETEEAILGLSLFCDPNISNEDKRSLAERKSVRYEQIFDFEKVRGLNLYPTSRRGTIWLDVITTPLKTVHGSISGYLTQIQDISDRKQMAEDLRKSEEKYRDLSDNAPIGILACDRDGNITYLNNRVLDMLGSPPVGDITEINLMQDKILMQTEFTDVLMDVLENGVKYPPFEIHYTSSRGKEVYLRMHVSPILVGDTPDGARIIVDNITRRKEAELLFERTQFAFDHSPDEIYFVNRDGLIVYANAHASESFGITSDTPPVHATIFDINPDISPERWRGIWSILEREGYFRMESVHRHPDGTPYPVDIIKYPIVFEGEMYSCTITRDITESKQTEEALRGVNKKLNLLSSITRHDILNQITGAAGFLEMIELEDEIPHGSHAENYLKKISGAVDTIERQITFTGYYKELGEQAPGWVDVGHVIEDVAETPSFEAVRVVSTIENIEVFADHLFEKVIYNLIDNAVKHGETITEISFYTEEKPDELIIVCEDDGVGIPADAKEKIFRREYFKNSGLGLFLSVEILSITGLRIIETGAPGVGARFEIHVPEEMFRAASPKGADER